MWLCRSVNGEISSYIEGIYTHFATADEGDISYAESQLAKFKDVVDLAAKYNINYNYILYCI